MKKSQRALLLAILRVLRQMRDQLRDLITLQQQQVDIYRAMLPAADDDEEHWKGKA